MCRWEADPVAHDLIDEINILQAIKLIIRLMLLKRLGKKNINIGRARPVDISR